MTICSRPANRTLPHPPPNTPPQQHLERGWGTMTLHTRMHTCVRCMHTPSLSYRKMCSWTRGDEGRGSSRSSSRGADEAAGLLARSNGCCISGRRPSLRSYIILPGRGNNVELLRQGGCFNESSPDPEDLTCTTSATSVKEDEILFISPSSIITTLGSSVFSEMPSI